MCVLVIVIEFIGYFYDIWEKGREKIWEVKVLKVIIGLVIYKGV